MTDKTKRESLARLEYWTATQAAFVLDVSASTIGRWIARGLAAKPSTEGKVTTWIIAAEDARAWQDNPHRRTRSKRTE